MSAIMVSQVTRAFVDALSTYVAKRPLPSLG